MPVGNSSRPSPSKTKKKEDISYKVREIKQRQENWLKQREQTKQQDEANSRSEAKAPNSKKGAKISTQPHLPITSITSTRRTAEIAERGKHVRDKFKNWMHTRGQTQPNDDDVEFNDSGSMQSCAESELERLVSPDPETRRQPVSEDNFGDLANQIADRVKENMGLSQSALHLSSMSSSPYMSENEMEVTNSWTPSRCRTFTQEVPSFNHLGTSGLTSHSCTLCKKLMLSSSHVPMMVIPCGHTLCKSCSEGRKTCPSCDCPVVSLTINIMLQQVIQEYHANPLPTKSSHNSEGLIDLSKDRIPSEGRNYSAGKYVEDNRRNQYASYKTQLTNLQTRHEVLTNELSTLSEHQKHLQSQLHQEQMQARSVKKQEEEISKTILELQERLETLKDHRHQYETQVKEIQDETSEVEGKITLLSTTICSLSREIEKVQLFLEAENGLHST